MGSELASQKRISWVESLTLAPVCEVLNVLTPLWRALWVMRPQCTMCRWQRWWWLMNVACSSVFQTQANLTMWKRCCRQAGVYRWPSPGRVPLHPLPPRHATRDGPRIPGPTAFRALCNRKSILSSGVLLGFHDGLQPCEAQVTAPQIRSPL